jgi:hypothetical protein
MNRLEYGTMRTGTLFLPMHDFGMADSYQVHALITGMRFLWSADSNQVPLDPNASPGFIFKILKKVPTEQDFDYFIQRVAGIYEHNTKQRSALVQRRNHLPVARQIIF